jgi:hypothetical protein
VESFKESIGIIIAAIIGSFIGTASKRNDSPLNMVLSVVSGISTAYIFTPIIVVYVGSEVRTDYAIAFLLGLLGMSIISILLAVVETLRNNPAQIIDILKEVLFRNKTTIINNNNTEKDNDTPSN